MKLKIILALVFFLLAMPFSLGEGLYVENQLIVLINEKSDNIGIMNDLYSKDESINSVVRAYNEKYNPPKNSIIGRTYYLGFKEGADLEVIKEKLSKDKDIELVDFNHIYKIQFEPNDPAFSLQWGLEKIGIAPTYDLEMGDSSVIIAILDTGVDLDHQDLDSNLLQGYDFVSCEQGGCTTCDYGNEDCDLEDNDPSDAHGHGTHVAGISSAITNNGFGVASVCPGCNILPVRVCYKSEDLNSYCRSNDIFEGIFYSINMSGGGIPSNDNVANIISMSFGGSEDNLFVDLAVEEAYNSNVVLVGAAGNNNNQNLFYPAAYSEVISVASIDENDSKGTSSNYGNWIDVSAPGVNIISTVIDFFEYKTGTSMAAPHVSGLAGLIISSYSGFTNDQVKDIIKNNTDSINQSNPGFEGLLGSGRINTLSSLQSFCSTGHASGECLNPGNDSSYCFNHEIIPNCSLCGCERGLICDQLVDHCFNPGIEICTDLVDNDQDGKYNCEDSDCANHPKCKTGGASPIMVKQTIEIGQTI